MKEREIQEAIRNALAFDRDVSVYRINPGVAKYGARTVRTAPTGMSDLVGLCAHVCPVCEGWRSGRMVALEVKTPKGRVSEAQQRFMDSVRSLGGFAAVVRSVEEAQEAVTRCKGGHLR